MVAALIEEIESGCVPIARIVFECVMHMGVTSQQVASCLGRMKKAGVWEECGENGGAGEKYMKPRTLFEFN